MKHTDQSHRRDLSFAVAAVPAILFSVVVAACSRAPPAPRIAADERRVDLGALWLGEERTHDFPCRNVGAAPLTFGEVRSTCGCLLADFSRADVAVGEARLLKVTFRADKSLGRVEKELRVATNDPANPWLVLTLAADVSVLYEFDPPVVAWNDLVLGEPRSARVRVKVIESAAVHFRAPTLDDAGFAAELIDPAQPLVEVRFDGHARVGSHLFHVVLPGDHPRVANALIPVEATVHARLDFPDGERFDFGDVARSRGATQRRRVRARGATPLAVDHPDAKVVQKGDAVAGPIAVDWSVVEAGREWTLALSIAPAATVGPLIGRIDVTLPGGDEPPHSLTLSGRVADH